MLNPNQTYHIKKQTLYNESGNQILKFIDKMPDGNNFTGESIKNMNRYVFLYPERVEIKKQQTNIQLNLF